MKTVILTVGIPGCGKTTVATQLGLGLAGGDLTKVAGFNRHLYRKILTGSEDNFTKEKEVTETIQKDFSDVLMKDSEVKVLVIHNTELKKEYRRTWAKLIDASNIEVQFIYLVFNCSIETSLKLQEGRDRKVSREVIERMLGGAQFPEGDEFADAVIYIDSANFLKE